MTVTVVTFILCVAVFTLVGIASSLKKGDTTDDYLIADRSVSPWLAALSSVATNNSGFMFVGLIGYTFRDGLHTVWMALAWLLGDLVAWLWVHQRVRETSERADVSSVPALLGTLGGRVQRPIIVVAGIMTFLFLGGYAAAQLNAGATALHSLFGWEHWVGAVGGAVIVVAYCYSGGIRASIWTDAVQSFVMLGSMALLLVYAGLEVGGPSALLAALRDIDPGLVQLFPESMSLGFPLYFLGFVAGGLGAVGQPHILVRTMAMDSPRSIPRARGVYFAWFIPFYLGAIAVALYARVLLPELAVAPAGLTGEAASSAVVAASEAALPELGLALLPDVFVGLLLAGLFSATMSTADSQILACSAAVTQDVAPSLRRSTRAAKAATLGVTALALVIALSAGQGVFALVLGAWSFLGAALGPLLVVRVFRIPTPTWLGLSMMASGALTVLLWGYSPWAGGVFKLLPGMVVPGLVFALWALFRPRASRTLSPTRG